MLKEFLKLIKNKIFLYLLLGINTGIFAFGFATSDINSMLLSIISFGAVLLGLELNKDSSTKEDD